jgi:hypothetical protein
MWNRFSAAVNNVAERRIRKWLHQRIDRDNWRGLASCISSAEK